MVHSTKRVKEDGPEGGEPLEEVGPATCDATAEMCERSPQDAASLEPVQDSEHRSTDELAEQFPVEDIPMVPHPVDGLPVPANERHGLALAAPFTIDHVVCVEDDRQYVEVFEEEFEAYEDLHGKIDARLRNQLQPRSRYTSDGEEEARCVFEPDAIVVRFGQHVRLVKHDEVVIGMMLVRSRRERCKYYKRQIFANDEVQDENEIGHRIVFRNCTLRRSIGGAFMSLRDEAVYACDYREPAHEPSAARYLDDVDRAKLRRNDHLRHLPLFGLTGEPEDYRGPARPIQPVDEPNGALAPTNKGVTP